MQEKNKLNNKIKKVVGIVSGKGGVGKSMVSSLLAVIANQKGLKTAILDSDATGPSIPKAFGITEKAHGTDKYLLPSYSKNGIAVMSVNLLLENDNDPVIWRGPMISGTIKQFWSDVLWGDIDIMFIDMPPGTGDIALTVFQSIPLDAIVIVTTPQELVEMIVEKAVKMAKLMNIPVLALVENMSYIKCPNCDEIIYPFGESNVNSIAKRNNIPNISQMPIDPALAKLVDNGQIEEYSGHYLDNVIEEIINIKKYSGKVFKL
ncbi:MAG: Mrp/NBP35 family ATP-binding protein [Eubacteriales bacterium]|nr:Mrp/NBP35 family ATP-binding protein [Eubacteriales bacterium]